MELPKSETYRENNVRYYSYHKQVAKAFQKDLEQLLLGFEAEQNLYFKPFAAVWRKMYFSFVFSGIEYVDELEFFTQACFTTIKKYIVFSDNIYTQVGAFYTLYCMFFKQPVSPRIRIRCTPEDFEHIQKVVKKLSDRVVLDGPCIFTMLQLHNAFDIVLFNSFYGLEGKFMWQEQELVDDIFESTKQGDPSQLVASLFNSKQYFGLDSITKVNEDYVKGLRQYGFSEEQCAATENFPKEMNELLQKMLSTDISDNSPSTSSEATSRSKELKNKAFVTKVKMPKK